MTSKVLYEFIVNHFYSWLKEKDFLPVILYLDGHGSHFTKHLSDFCFEKLIHLLALLPNATHLLQPMDVALFRALKKAYQKEIRNYRLEKNGAVLTKAFFPSVLKKIFIFIRFS